MLVSGEKRIELRVAKRRFTCIEAQSYFRVQRSSPPQSAMFKILRATHYRCLEDAFAAEGVGNILPGVTCMSAGIASFQQLYGTQQLEPGLVAFELSSCKAEASAAPARRAPPILHGRAADPADAAHGAAGESMLRVRGAWRYPTETKGFGELTLQPQWDLLAKKNPDWCLEATAFCVLGEQSCPLPDEEGLEFILDLGDSKPRWGQVKVCLTVWDEVVLRTARSAFFGQAWLPPLWQAGGEVRLPLLRGAASAASAGELSVSASWEYPAAGTESQGRLALRGLSLSPCPGPAYVVARVFHQSCRGIEGCGTHKVVLKVPVSGAGGGAAGRKKAPNPARLGDERPEPVLRVATPKTKRSEVRFVVPGSLVKLGRRLRFAGLDCAIVDSLQAAQQQAAAERRHLLVLEGSRSPGIALPRKALEEQLQYVLDHLGLWLDPSSMASRCAECNGHRFRLASREEIAASEELHASTLERYSEFWRCCSCRKLYWEGGAWCRSLRALKPSEAEAESGKALPLPDRVFPNRRVLRSGFGSFAPKENHMCVKHPSTQGPTWMGRPWEPKGKPKGTQLFWVHFLI
ncbi:unnamed protein product [Effrenium voratum]|uniref:Mut7-C RNAse domain-containing protein n=1 Tax=Effrenium voratum TaxID=2562239 RepID=A0AA36J7T9_9DINO|nr:unnamed protein product [Effrenium voratum]